MKPKIIIADDSQTIQKVIKIYLANGDYELFECHSDSELMPLVNEHNPDIVLLDFNLSENKTGYDLSREIKQACSAKILMLYGTFDTIDESLFDEAGVNAHIVKPFDGNKFLGLIDTFLSDAELEGETTETKAVEDEIEGEELVEVDVPEEIEAEEIQAEELEADEISKEVEEPIAEESKLDQVINDQAGVEVGDEWVVNQPEVIEEEVEEESLSSEEKVSQAELNTLEEGIRDWGMDVPNVIGAGESSFELPPVIDEEAGGFEQMTTAAVAEAEEDTLLPADQDLEYPNADEIKAEVETIVPEEEPEFTALSTLKYAGPDEDTKTIDLSATLGTATEEEVQSLEEQIADEVEEDKIELSQENIAELWKTDEVVEEKAGEEFEQVETTATTESAAIDISQEDIAKKIDDMIGPLVEKIVREKIDAVIEKVSWEIIPDLAENLIKKELKTVTDEILQSAKND